MLILLFLVTTLLNFQSSVLAATKFSRNDFPSGFIFGSGTSAYQVEGAANEDGRSPSIWDTFAHAGYGHGGTGDVACDEYHKYKEDVRLMAGIGLDAYRFSISWSRLIPNGRGYVNPKGLEYYNNLINELISHGVQPHVSLYHYDLPQVLEDEYGGWLNRTIVKDFTAYADVCFQEFGDRVLYWTTLSEPNAFALEGYDEGVCPPRRCSPPFGTNCSGGNSSSEPYIVAHNMLLAHASAARLYEKQYKAKQQGFVGISVFTYGVSPLTDSKEDKIAAERVLDFSIGWILHPLFFGDYPDIMKKIVGSRMPAFNHTESEHVKGSCDFIGVIHYTTMKIKDKSSSLELKERDFYADMAAELIGNNDPSSGKFPSMPWGLEALLEYFKQTYGNPTIYIVENGQVTLRNSSLEDTTRVEYLHAYIGAVLDAVRNGSNTKGYFSWSFLDLYELLSGYQASYGLFYVDFKDPDLKRYPRLSAYWYSHLLKGTTVTANGFSQLPDNSSSSLSWF
ncbi:beta-glucosidase 11-like isoform X2 [Carica papaya]|uniref:beta-glucosidase 11-like isoform X2 n=1 Tax=Carica papaya TaxID=3649 RepID=UPI000B8CDFE4|nr:beta-glucosidase 11-like isoform X2 [Carica papaya]